MIKLYPIFSIQQKTAYFFFQAEDGIRDRFTWLEFRRVLFRSNYDFVCFAAQSFWDLATILIVPNLLSSSRISIHKRKRNGLQKFTVNNHSESQFTVISDYFNYWTCCPLRQNPNPIECDINKWILLNRWNFCFVLQMIFWQKPLEEHKSEKFLLHHTFPFHTNENCWR